MRGHQHPINRKLTPKSLPQVHSLYGIKPRLERDLLWLSKIVSDGPRDAFTAVVATIRFASDEMYAPSKMDVVPFMAGAMSCYSS